MDYLKEYTLEEIQNKERLEEVLNIFEINEFYRIYDEIDQAYEEIGNKNAYWEGIKIGTTLPRETYWSQINKFWIKEIFCKFLQFLFPLIIL